MLDTGAPGHAGTPLRRLMPRSFGGLIASWLRSRLNRVQEFGPAALPIASYVRSGLFLLAVSAKHQRTTPADHPTAMDLLAWAVLDTWRTRLLGEAEVASAVSQDASLLLVEMPAVRRILKLVRQHIRLARHYSAEAYQGRVTLFRALHSEPSERRTVDLTLGWALLAADGVEIHTIRANHVALLVKPYVNILAQELAVCLDRGRGSPEGSTRLEANQ